MKFLLYNGRHGEQILTEHTPNAWEYLKNEMQRDNNATFEDIRRDFGDDAMYGHLDYRSEAHLSIDDGGEISTVYLTEVDMTGLV